MEKEKGIIILFICILASVWSFWLMVYLWQPTKIINLGVAEQRKIYTEEITVYLDDKPLPACSEDIETRICRYSCAPDGVCLFIPREIIEQYQFTK